MSSWIYVLLPFIAWVIAGGIKFLCNSFRFRGEGVQRIGNGGFPSTHTAVVTTVTCFIGLHEGFKTPYFLLAITFLFITILDAIGVRRTVGLHAEYINELLPKDKQKLRELQGHKLHEILGGLVLGMVLGYLANLVG